MAKLVPPSALDVTIVPVGVKAAVAATGARSGDLFMVPLDQFYVIPDFNLRVTGTPDYEAGIEELAALILENGFYRDKPISVLPQTIEEKPVFSITDGHRRYAAAKRAIEMGAAIEALPAVVVQSGTSVEDLTVAMMQNGTTLTVFERAIGVSRLAKYGWAIEQIAKRLNITKVYVDDLLTLMSAPAKIRAMVMRGEVSASTAVKAYRADPKKALEVLTAALEGAVSRGKGKAAPKDVAKASESAGASRTRKPNPNRSEFVLEGQQDDEFELSDAEPFLKIAGGEWFVMSEESPDKIRLLGDTKIKISATIKPPKTAAPAAPGADVADL